MQRQEPAGKHSQQQISAGETAQLVSVADRQRGQKKGSQTEPVSGDDQGGDINLRITYKYGSRRNSQYADGNREIRRKWRSLVHKLRI